jgi:hypothetical protein
MKPTITAAVLGFVVLGACSVLNAPEALDAEGSGGSSTGATGNAGGKDNTGGSKNQGGDGTSGTMIGSAGCGLDCPEGGAPPIGRDCDVSADDCGSTAPICDATAFECRPCASDPECNTELQLPYCVKTGAETGRCVECVSPADCSDATPVCNPLGVCRICVEHSECASGVCDPSGTCVAEGEIVYALAQTGNSNATCGTLADPCLRVTTAVGKLTAQRSTLVLIETAAAFDNESASLPAVRGLKVIGNGVTIQSSSGMSVFRVPPNAGVTFHNVVIEGATDEDEGGIECTDGEIVVEGSTLQDNGVGVLAMDCDVTVTRSRILHNANPLTFSQAGIVAGCTVDGCNKRLLVTQNRFIDNGVAIYNWNQLNATLENNLFLRNGADGYTRVLELRATNTRLAYNTLVENYNSCTYVGIVACIGTCTSIGNISFRSFPAETEPCYDQVWYGTMPTYSLTEITQPGGTNKTGDPLFVDAANGDFTPGPTSPALNAGNPADAPMDDIDGNPRGDAPDMGAFEAQ